jgi:hypothetical protein
LVFFLRSSVTEDFRQINQSFPEFSSSMFMNPFRLSLEKAPERPNCLLFVRNTSPPSYWPKWAVSHWKLLRPGLLLQQLQRHIVDRIYFANGFSLNYIGSEYSYACKAMLPSVENCSWSCSTAQSSQLLVHQGKILHGNFQQIY